MVAFLGMGLLGSNFVRAMSGKGAKVNVWNRTASKAAALEQYGAKTFAHPADAVKEADAIHLTLKDDAAVDEPHRLADRVAHGDVGGGPLGRHLVDVEAIECIEALAPRDDGLPFRVERHSGGTIPVGVALALPRP